MSPAGRSTYDWFGNAAFAAANDEYGDVITALRPAPHATNGGTGSPPTTGTVVAGAAGAIVVDDASFPASTDNTSAVIDITSPRTTYFELRTPTGISRRVTSGCRHRRPGRMQTEQKGPQPRCNDLGIEVTAESLLRHVRGGQPERLVVEQFDQDGHGGGRVVERPEPRFDALVAEFGDRPDGSRQDRQAGGHGLDDRE